MLNHQDSLLFLSHWVILFSLKAKGAYLSILRWGPSRRVFRSIRGQMLKLFGQPDPFADLARVAHSTKADLFLDITANGGVTVANGQTLTLTGLSGVLKASTGAVSGSATIDDISDGTSYQRVAAADVNASGHVDRFYNSGGTSYIQVTGNTGAITLTVDDASQTLAARNRDNTYTGTETLQGNVVVGNEDTDTLTIRSMIIGGNPRAVQISATVASPTYAPVS